MSNDLVDATNDKKVLSKCEKLNIVIAKKLQEKGLKSILISNNEVIGKYIGKDLKEKNGEVIVSAGFDITEEQLEKVILKSGFNITKESLDKILQSEIYNLHLENLDPIIKGTYIFETIKIVEYFFGNFYRRCFTWS